MNKTPTTLIIMDGFGLAEPGPGNAISLAATPVLDRLFAEAPTTRLAASGEQAPRQGDGRALPQRLLLEQGGQRVQPAFARHIRRPVADRPHRDV